VFAVLVAAVTALSTHGSAGETESMPAPEVIIFDVNETLLDMAPLRKSVGHALAGNDELLPQWFSTMLHYSLVETMTGEYHDFGEIGTAALLMVATSRDIELDPAEARQAITGTITRLPAHADVVPTLKALADLGFRVVSLTNSSNAGVAAQFEFAGITDLVERRFSVEDLRVYKPDLRTYRWVLEQLDIEPEQALMVAAHPWDLAGARAAGLQTAFIRRQGTVLYPLAARPDYIVDDLQELVTQLEAR